MPADTTILALYMTHRGALVNYASRIVGDRGHAEDVVQEAYIRFSAAGDAARGGQPINNPVGYLYRIVRNLALDWARRGAAAAAEAVDGGSDRAVDATPSVEQALLYRDELRVLAEALAELPERTRTAFEMHRLQGRTLREVADRLGVSVVRAHQMVKEAILHGARRLDGDDR
jgi:RNA polymerase sigma-70 factor (ECF subfamily)